MSILRFILLDGISAISEQPFYVHEQKHLFISCMYGAALTSKVFVHPTNKSAGFGFVKRAKCYAWSYVCMSAMIPEAPKSRFITDFWPSHYMADHVKQSFDSFHPYNP